MESLRFPKQVTGDPGYTYPIEVTATTSGGACNVTTPVGNLTVDKTQDGGCQLCWDASLDPCVQAYDIFAAPTPELPGNFESVSQTGLQTCWTGAPSGNFFLVRGRGTGGVGP